MSRNEDEIESEIQAKNLNAPRLTPRLIDDQIIAELYYNPSGRDQVHVINAELGPLVTESLGCLTICVLVLRNGFTVVGKSACASRANFDLELGRKIAREDARTQLWPLLGFALKNQLMAQEKVV